MFKPKRIKGGSYTYQVDIYGKFPTVQEMFSLLNINSFNTTLTTDENIFNTSAFRQNTEILNIQASTISTAQYYSTMVDLYSQQSSLAIMNNVISSINLQTQTGVYNTLLVKYSTNYTKYKKSIESYEYYSTIEALSISRYMNEYSDLLTTSIPFTNRDNQSFIDSLQNYVDSLPNEIMYNMSVSYISSLIRSYTAIYTSNLFNLCTLVSTKINPEQSTIKGLYDVSSLVAYGVESNYANLIHSSSVSVYSTQLIEMLQEVLLTQQEIYLHEASALILQAKKGGYYNTCIDSINRLAVLGGTYDFTTTTMLGGGDTTTGGYTTTTGNRTTTITLHPSAFLIYPELQNKISSLVNHSGKIQDLQTLSTSQISSIKSINTLINEISSGTIKLGQSTASNLQDFVNMNAYQYNLLSNTANENISTNFSYEIQNYINILEGISSFLTINLVGNTLESHNITYNSFGITNTNISNQSISRVQTLSTNSKKTHDIKNATSTFINMLNAEAFVKKYYIQLKSAYESQSYYSLVSDPNYDSSYFDNVTTLYQLSIQNVNRYINNRENYYNNFVDSITSAVSTRVIRPDVYLQMINTSDITKNITKETTTRISTYTISSILPLQMQFNLVPLFSTIFTQRSLPPKVLLYCPSTPITYQSQVEDRIPPIIPTIPEDTIQYGVMGQYISIVRPDNNIEILQILVIDSTGKNVAYRASVTAPSISNVSQQTTSGSIRQQPLTTIVNGNYDTETSPQSISFISLPTPTTIGNTKTIWINLGDTYDITAIQYLKSSQSSYNSSGFIFQIYRSDQQTPVGLSQTTSTNTPVEILDFRRIINPDVPISPVNLRNGKCGILARYVNIVPSSSRILQVSQVAIISSDGSNLALQANPIYVSGYLGTVEAVPYINDGSYYSRPLLSCFNLTDIPNDSYIQFDLESEMDITSVILYNTNTGESHQFGTDIQLFTEDNQFAISKMAITNNMKEVIDFCFEGANSYCPTEVIWPSYYGVAGIIVQYISLQRTDSAALGFTKLQLIDKSGRDVGLFQPTQTTSVPEKSYLGVTNYNSNQPSSICYVSNSSESNQEFVVDLQQSYEICAVNILACSDDPDLLDNTTLNFYADNPLTTTNATSFYKKPVVLTNLSSFYDTRYDPESSTARTSVDPTKTGYGPFGTMAVSAMIPGIYSGIQITEAAGQDLYPDSIISTIGTSTLITFNKDSNIFEINSIVINDPAVSTDLFITLYGCDEVVVNRQPIQNYLDTSLNSPRTFKLADFRNPSRSPYAPMEPLLGLYYKDISSTSSGASSHYAPLIALYEKVNLDTGINNMPPKGLIAKYVKIIPRDSVTPLYTSQVVVVDSNGMNIAFQKDTFTPNISIGHTTKYAVDGVYAVNIDDPNYNKLASLADYISRPITQSFVSVPGPQANNYLVINLGSEFFVNSVIYISSKDKNEFGLGVIVELYDSNLVRVGIRVVSQYVSLFGVDVLDFRVDRTEKVSDPGAWLEVRPRVVQLGESCGMMAQYIRIISAVSGSSFQFSQLIATDSNGNNIALYKPVYSSTNQANAYRIVDGSYYQRLPQYSYTSIPQNDPSTDYVEVNFGNEIALLNLYVINTLNSTSYSTMKILVYNASRDIIATLKLSGTNYMNLPLNSDNFFTPSILNNRNTIPVYDTTLPVLGVNILTKLSPFLITAGLLPGSAMPPESTTPTPITKTFPISLQGLCDYTPPVSANLNNKFTRGPNNEIPGRFVRIYNVDKYIQISQIMVYGNDGTNYAYQAKCMSESVFPGTYIDTVTDGEGGYFHTARPCSQCFKSGGEIYDFLQVDLGTTCQIAGVRCVFASDDQGQNIGSSIQILSEEDGDPAAILARHIVGAEEYEEALVDFRFPPGNISIKQIIMPKIYTLPNLPSGLSGPNGILEAANGKVYIVDTMNHCVWSVENSVSSVFYGTPGTPGILNYPVGIATDGNYLYISDFGNNRILRLDSLLTTFIISINNPYGLLCANGQILCTSYNLDGNIYVYNSDNSVQTLSTGIPYPNSIILADAYYVTSATTATVYRLNLTGVGIPYISSNTLLLKSTAGITYDSSENIMFISDYIQDKIFAVLLGTDPIKTYNLAGTGNGGYTGDGSQAVLATMDGPMCIFYSHANGYLYISDYKNSVVRYLELYSKPPKSYSITTTSPAWFGWSTETLSPVVFTPPPTRTIETLVNINKITQILNPAVISILLGGQTNISAFYARNSNIYYAEINIIKVYSLENKTSTVLNSSTTFGNISCITGDSDSLYICDSSKNAIYKMGYDGSNAAQYLASAGTLSNPTWIGFDKNGVLYVSDTGNYCIRRVNGFGKFEIYAGQEGKKGSNDTNTGTNYGILKTLNAPGAFVFDSNNFLIFLDTGSNTIYKIVSENRMSPICPGGPTIMGWSVSNTGSLEPTTTAATVQFSDTFYKMSQIPNNSLNIKLRNPSGITIDASGSLYVTASSGQQIVQITYNMITGIYMPTILSGFGSDKVGRSLSTDNYNVYAKYACLNNPTTIQYYNNKLYFLENNRIRNITFDITETFPLNTTIPYGPLLYIGNNTKNTCNTSASSGINETVGILENIQSNFICCSSNGTVYLGNNYTVSVTPTSGRVISIDSNNVLSVIVSGFGIIQGIALYNDTILYVADSTNNNIKSIILPTGYTKILLQINGIYALAINPIGFIFYSYGNNVGCYNLKDSSGTTVSISLTETVLALVVDTDGNLYVSTGTKIYQYIILYSSSGPTVSTNSALSLGTFTGPYNGLAFFNGNLYFSSYGASSVCYIPVIPNIGTGVVIVGQNSIRGPAIDGSYSNTVSLYRPSGLCIDINRNLFILDTIPLTGQSTLLRNTNFMVLEGGLTYTITGTNTVGTATNYISNTFAYLEMFNNIGSVCYDSLGQIYISDTGNHCISIIDLSGMIHTFAGNVGTPGYSGDGRLATSALLKAPQDIKMSQSNVLYIADTGNNCIRRVKIYNDGYHIATFGQLLSFPTAIAIDSKENVYVVYSNNPIQTTTKKVIGTSSILYITPTKQNTPYFTASYTINAIAINSLDQVYYTTIDSVYIILSESSSPIQILTGLSSPMGLSFDNLDNIYISDTGNNKVYQILAGNIPRSATPITNFTVYVGNGLIEPVYTIIPSIALNINANGTIPTDRALYAPGSLAFNAMKGLLIGQPTKITLYSNNGDTNISSSCGIETTTIEINNPNPTTVYLSQIVVLNNNGLNIALGSNVYQDGFYGCKPVSSSYAILSNTKLTFNVSGSVVCILLYFGLDGNSYTKTNWNGVKLILGGNVRTIINITNTYSLQYIIFDYRKKTPECLPFNNYINKFKLQTNSTTLSSSYTQKYIRYIRIIPNSSNNVSLSQVAVIHADTGVDLGPSSVVTASNSGITPGYTNNKYYVETNPVSTIDKWIEFDLGDEYPIDQIILYSNNLTTSYKIFSYTNMRTEVVLPVFSFLDNLVAYVLLQGINNAVITITDINGKTVTSSTVKGSNYIELTIPIPIYIETITINSGASTTTPCTLYFYNQSRNTLYTTPVLFPFFTLSYNNSPVYSYSLSPIIGTKNVRYIKYISNSSSIQISQILAIDVNGINVAYKKSVIGFQSEIVSSGSTTALATPYTGLINNFIIDLGEEYEIIQVIYVNSSSNQINQKSCQISLQDSLKNQLLTPYEIQGNSQVEIYDTRTTGRYLSLTYSPTASIDSLFVGALRGRYVRFENPTGNLDGFTISNVIIYDIYGKCISAGKTTLIPSTPRKSGYYLQSLPITSNASQNAFNNIGYTNLQISTPGDWWEIDLGQTYSIKDIFVNITNSLTIPYVIYNFYRGEVYRSFTNGHVSLPVVAPTNPPVNTLANSIRFIRISGNGSFDLTHLAVIDSRGIDICVWKSCRLVDALGNVSYFTFNGRYKNSISITSTLDIDLGKSYNICSVISYGSGDGFTLSTYTSTGTIVNAIALVSNPQIIGGGYTSVQKTTKYGKKARYVLLNNSSSISFNTLAVIDSLGRNLAYNSKITYTNSGSTFTLPYDLISPIELNNVKIILIDLGQEYYVSFVSVYSLIPTSVTVYTNLTTTPGFMQSMVGTNVTLMDSSWSNTGSITMTGSGSTYNIIYSLGNIFDRVTSNPNITNVSITTTAYDTPISIPNINSFMFDSQGNLYALFFVTAAASSQNFFGFIYPSFITSLFSASSSSLNNSLNNINIYYIKPVYELLYGSIIKRYYYACGTYTNTTINQTVGFFAQIAYDNTISSKWTLDDTNASLALNTYLPNTYKFVMKNNYIYFLTDTIIYRVGYQDNNMGKLTLSSAITPYISNLPSDVSASINDFDVDSKNNLYLSSSKGVYKYPASNLGSPTYFQTFININGSTGSFNYPIGLYVDINDYVFVADSKNNSIRVILPIEYVTPVYTVLNGQYSFIRFTVDQSGNLYALQSNIPYIQMINITSIPNINLPFISNISTTHNGTYPVSSTYSSGVQTLNNNLVGASFLETLDFTV